MNRSIYVISSAPGPIKIGIVAAFPGGRGTADMVGQARQAGVKVIELS